MKKVNRKRVVLLGLAVLLGWAAFWWFLVLPKAMKEVKEPREGRVKTRNEERPARQPERDVKAPNEGHLPDVGVAVVFSAHYDISLGGIELFYHFDIHKYANIYRQLVADGLLRPEDVFVPDEVSRDDLLLVHTENYLRKLGISENVAEYLEFGPVGFMPSSLVDAVVLRAFRYCTSGTILASRLALRHGIGINLGGGYHHAKPEKGAGFCVYADVPIAIRKLQKEGLIKRALLVDLDVHQGDGSAVCLQDDDDVFTFSIHEENLYPVPKAKSDLDVGIPWGVGDEEYLKILRENLPDVIRRARPDIIYLLAGTDVYIEDTLGHTRLTSKGIVDRDMAVVDAAVSRRIPFVMVLSGGYSQESWQLHYNSIRKIIETYTKAKHGDRDEPKP